MKVEYSITQLSFNRYVLTFTLPTIEGEPIKGATTTRTNVKTLKELLARTNQAIAVAAHYYRRENDKVYSDKAFKYEWDGDDTNLSDCFKADVAVYKYMKGLTSAKIVAEPQPIEKVEQPQKSQNTAGKRLYEVVKQNDVWTIKKHETELLTWEEAATELAKRI